MKNQELSRPVRWALTVLAGILFAGSTAQAQLTREQKLADFHQLAAIYAKNYKPYEWKMEAFGFDLFSLKPWIEMVERSKDDLEFYDVCVRYVAALKDSHDEFMLPSDFVAELPIFTDLYDGKMLIEAVDRTILPPAQYPIRFGDEVVAVDGKPVEEWITELLPYAANGAGNESAARRIAAETIVFRPQVYYPFAPRIGATASVVIRDADGTETTYEIPWETFGTPLLTVGPVQNPILNSVSPNRRSRRTAPQGRYRADGAAPAYSRVPVTDVEMGDPDPNPWGTYNGPEEPRTEEFVPSYMRVLHDLQNSEAVGPKYASAGFGFRNPVFRPPVGFVQRLGGSSSDQFVSGTFPLGDYRVGFIRIPTMSPTNQTQALTQFQNEILYFNENTRGLVIDVMHNGGGSLCYVEALLRMLIPYPFRSIAYEIRSTEFWTQVFSSSLTNAKILNAEPWVIELYTNYLAQVEQARKELRGSTGNLPICGISFEDIPPATDRNGAIIAYRAPILVLANEFSLSAAEAFTALLQDAERVSVLGTRTTGGGGNPASYNAGTYSMGATRATRTLLTRKTTVITPNFPPANHLENAGVYPDYWEDIQTEENLFTAGSRFVDAFTAVMADMVARSRQ